MECFILLFDYLEWIEHRFLSGIRDSRNAGSLRGMMRGERGVKKSIHPSWLVKGLGLGLGLLCWSFKGVQEDFSVGRGRHSSNLISGITTRPINQPTTPCLSQTLRPRWASTQFLSLPIVKPCSQWLLLIPKAQRLSLLDNLGDERGCDEGHWHTHTRGLPWGLPEVVGMVQQVHCNRRRLLQRGLEFHVCTKNKSAHTKNVGNLFNDTRMMYLSGHPCKYKTESWLLNFKDFVKFCI